MEKHTILDFIPLEYQKKWKKVEFNKGDIIIEINDEVTAGYIFSYGGIDVIHLNSSFTPYVYDDIKQCEFIGLMEIFSQSNKYCCTCRANRKCVGYVVSKEDLIKLLNTNFEFNRYLVNYWAKIFYKSSTNIQRYPNNKSLYKLCDYLYKEALKYENTDIVNLKLKKEILAEILGINIRTVYRLLNELLDKGLIIKENQEIVITNKHKERLLEFLSQ